MKKSEARAIAEALIEVLLERLAGSEEGSKAKPKKRVLRAAKDHPFVARNGSKVRASTAGQGRTRVAKKNPGVTEMVDARFPAELEAERHYRMRCPEGVELESFRSTLAAKGFHRYGRHCFHTTVFNGRGEIDGWVRYFWSGPVELKVVGSD